MKTLNAVSVVIMGTSTVTREIASALSRFDVRAELTTNAAAALHALAWQKPDLLLVEMSAVGFGEIGLTELAEAARKGGTRLALLTSRSVMDTIACATVLRAMATLNKWMPVKVTAERLKSLATQARGSHGDGFMLDSVVPLVSNDHAFLAHLG